MMGRILFLTTNDSNSWGGSEELWYGAALHCRNIGYEVGICIKDHQPMPNKIATLFTDKGIRLFLKKRPVMQDAIFVFNKLVPVGLKIQTEPSYKKDLLLWKPDLVVISQGNNLEAVPMMEFFATHKLRYVTITQAVYEGIWPSTSMSERMSKSYDGSVMNYFVSKANLKVTEFQIGEKLANSKVVRNPFNVPYENDLSFIKSDIVQWACVARYEFFAKGQDVLLEVLNEKKWRERNICVNFYGQGANEPGIRKLIRYFDLDNATIQGFEQTLAIWIKNSALVLPSRFEGLPLALVEAMLCGRFGIVTNVSGNKEVIEDNINGFLAEGLQPEYLDAAMERAWQRMDDWESIGLKAKAHVKSLISENPIDKFCEDIIRFL